MKKILLIMFILNNLFAQNVGETKSFRALKMDGYDKDRIETLEIQIDVKKVYLNEYEKNSPPTPTAEDNKRGYILFFRNYLFDVFAFSNPTAEEINKKDIKVFATLGEYEPIVFSVYPLTKLTNCKVLVSEFVNEKGDKISSEAFQVNNVIHRPIGEDSIVVRGEVLKRAKEIPLIDEGVCKTIWINVKVPEDTKGGTYKGKITFAPSGKPSSDISVEVNVLPFKLIQPPPDVITWAPIMAGTWAFEQLEKELIAIKEHGMTGEITSCLVPEGDDFTKANKYMEIAKKVGLTGKFVVHGLVITGTSKLETTYGLGERGSRLFSQPTYNKLKDLVTKIRDNALKNNWLPYIIYLSSELGSTSNSPNKDDFAKVMKGAEEYYEAAREVKGVKLLATFNRREELIMHWNLPTLDEIGFNGEMFPEWEEAAKAKPSWMTFIEIDQRCGHGFYLWKFNLKGVRPWCLHPYVMHSREQGLLYYEDKEEHPSVRFERIREGVDDYKYLYTLTEYIKQAKEKGKDTSSAENTIKRIIDKIPYNHKKDTPGFDYAKLDEYRWEIAQEILKLR